MRLREIANVLDHVNLSDIELNLPYSSADYRTIENLVDFRNAVNQVSEIKSLQCITNKIKESPVFSTISDEFTISKSQARDLEVLSNKLVLVATAFREVIKSQLSDEKNESIVIKLPEDRDLRTLVGDLDIIEKAISQIVINDEIDGVVQVITWEPGSLWIEIYLGSIAAVSLVGSSVWAAMVIRKKREEARMFEQHARTLELKNEALENLIDGQKRAIELQLESESKALENEYFTGVEPSPERIQRLQYAVKSFSKLIERGAEIHPALSAPEPVSNLFPANINPLAIESRIKHLGNSNEGKE
jgi:hypothetical protein